MQAMTKCLRHNFDTLEDWIHQMAEFEKKMAYQIAEFKKMMAEIFPQIAEEKTMSESLDHMGETEKTMAEIAGTLSNEHINRDQSAYRAS